MAATPKEIYDTGADNQWPYQFTLDNTEPDGDKCRVIKKYGLNKRMIISEKVTLSSSLKIIIRFC